MTRRHIRAYVLVLLVGTAAVRLASPPPARAFNPIKPICSVAGFVNGLAGKACSVAQNGGRVTDAGKQLLGGHLGSAFKTALGDTSGSVASKATTALALAAIGTWVLGGARFVLHETSHVLAETTAPQLQSTWFSGTYWRVAGIAAVLTLPFLFAAGLQALLRSDMTVLIRAALGYLPLAMLAVAIAAPITMLLLAASDQLAAVVSSAAGHQSAHFLNRASGLIGGLTYISRSPFLAFLVGILTVLGALAVWIELLMREAAVYVIVLMLPLAFAAFVWPARRMWAIRSVELLVALILSKFAIVAVLSLGGAALSHAGAHSVTGTLAGVVLLVLGAFAPWALLRLVPLAEIASGAAGSLRGDARAGLSALQHSDSLATEGEQWASKAAQMRRTAGDVQNGNAALSQVEQLAANAAPPQGEPSVEGAAQEGTGDGEVSAAGASGVSAAGASGASSAPAASSFPPGAAASSTAEAALSPQDDAAPQTPDTEPDLAQPAPVFRADNFSRVISSDERRNGSSAAARREGSASERRQQDGPAPDESQDPSPPPRPPDRGLL